jgi:hypothetical protein
LKGLAHDEQPNSLFQSLDLASDKTSNQAHATWSPNHLPGEIEQFVSRNGGDTYLQLRHKCFQGVEKDAGVGVCNRLLVQTLLQGAEQCVELFGFDHWPGYNVDSPTVKPRYEVSLLLALNNLLELEAEPVVHD